MALGVRKGKTNKPVLAAALRHAFKRSFEAVARHSILAGAVLAMVLAMFAVEALSSGAATVPTVTTLTVTNPLPSVAGGQGASALLGSALSPSSASSDGSGDSAGAGDVLAQSSAGARQRQLRSLVVRLSQCLATLQPQAQRVLLLRAGIATAGPDSPSAVSRISHIGRVREAGVEDAALVELQSAAREDRCASTFAALIQVPPHNRLVSADSVLTSQGQSSGSAQASRADVSAVGRGKAKLSFTLTTGKNAAAIKTLVVALPRGIAFSSSKPHLVKEIVVNAGGKRPELTAKVSHGKLTIELKTSARSVRVTIAGRAVTVSKTLAHRLKTGNVKTLQIPVTATNSRHNTTRMTLKADAN
jgi:hypothetical protein